MEHPLISVLIPAYNAGDTIEDCLRAVLAQDWPALEAVVVDDGSTDQTAAVCKQIAAADPRVRLISRENRGSAAARNTALDHAGGEWLAFVDADDWVFPGFLSHLYGLCTAFGTRVAMCRFQDVPARARPQAPGPASEPDCAMDFETYCDALYSPRQVEMTVLWNKLYHAALWQGLRFRPGLRIDDESMTWKLVNRAGRIAVSTLPLYIYHTGGPGVMRGPGAHLRRADMVPCLTERLAFFEENGCEYLAWRTRHCLLLEALDIRRLAGRSGEERALKKEMSALYRSQLGAFRAHPRTGRRLWLRMKAFGLAPPLFARTSRNRELFGG